MGIPERNLLMTRILIDGYSIYIGTTSTEFDSTVVCNTLYDPIMKIVNTCGRILNGDKRAGGTAWVPGKEGKTYVFATAASK